MPKPTLKQSADILVNQLLNLQAGAEVVITADMLSDKNLIEALAAAVSAVGAKPLLVWMNTPGGVSEAADPDLPGHSLTAMLSAADVWLELNCRWLLYSNVYYQAMRANQHLRHMCLTGVDADSLVNCVGSVDYAAMEEFTLLLRDKIKAARHMRMTSALGGYISFENSLDNPVSCKLGRVDKPGTHLFVGQIGWTPLLESINGVIVLDGSIAPDIGIITTPVRMEIRAGGVEAISGGSQAAAYGAWLGGYNHPQMLRVAHTGIGFNPGAAVKGSIIEDQRVMGSTTWGFGSIGAGLVPPQGVKAPSHSDAVCLNTTVEADGVTWLRQGQFIEPELAKLAQRLKK